MWGGSTPETGFDCSGYVCWVYNQNGYDVGRTTANGLWNKSQHISEAEAKIRLGKVMWASTSETA